MATQQKAQIQTAADVTWSNGDKFDGFLLLGIALPSGYADVYLEDDYRRTRLPLWTAIPVKNGVVNQDYRVWFNSSLVPPSSKYTAYWYDSQFRLIAAGVLTLFTVEVDPYVIGVPTLTVPTAPVGPPTPEATPAGPSQVVITLSTPIFEVPTGTVNGVNDTFTVSTVPGRLAVMKNGLVLKDGLGYILTGSTIVFQAGYIPQVGDVLLTLLWS